MGHRPFPQFSMLVPTIVLLSFLSSCGGEQNSLAENAGKQSSQSKMNVIDDPTLANDRKINPSDIREEDGIRYEVGVIVAELKSSASQTDFRNFLTANSAEVIEVKGNTIYIRSSKANNLRELMQFAGKARESGNFSYAYTNFFGNVK